MYAVAPAERFAAGGVRTLHATGVVTDLAFGCEAPDLRTLYQISDIIATEPPALQEAIKKHLALGKSYPRARFDALSEYGVPKNMLAAIAQPNNILAVEYLGAIRQYAGKSNPCRSSASEPDTTARRSQANLPAQPRFVRRLSRVEARS